MVEEATLEVAMVNEAVEEAAHEGVGSVGCQV